MRFRRGVSILKQIPGLLMSRLRYSHNFLRTWVRCVSSGIHSIKSVFTE